MQRDHTDQPLPSNDSRLTGWPKLSDYPETEAGYNDFMDAWTARRRRASRLGDIPMQAVEEHRAAVAAARERGWNEIESG